MDSQLEELMMRSGLEYRYFKHKYPLKDTMIAVRDFFVTQLKRNERTRYEEDKAKLEKFVKNFSNAEQQYLFVDGSLLCIDKESYERLLKTYVLDKFDAMPSFVKKH